MKKILFTLALTLVIAVSTFAQFDTGYPKLVRGNWGLEIQVEATMDGSSYDSLTTGWVDISDFDDALEYAQIYYLMTDDGSGAADTSWLLIDAYGNEAASWTGAVNLGQLVDTTDSQSAVYVASTISNKRPKYINFIFEQATTVAGGNLDDSIDCKLRFRFPIKDAGVPQQR